MTQRERRAAPRHPASLDVRYRLVGEAAHDPARDLSTGGVFVSCDDPLPLGAAVEVVLDDASDPLVLAAEVVRVVWGGRKEGAPVAAGMALRFNDVSDDARARLERLLDEGGA